MVIPLADDNSDRTITPVVNYALIAINVLVFVFAQGLGGNDRVTLEFSTVPERIITGKNVEIPEKVLRDDITGTRIELPSVPPTPISVYLTLLTSMFLHGSIAHIGGNMLFLWIFGDNIEDALGHLRYLLFYLLCGVLASLCQIASTVVSHGNLQTPSLGASGAISGVLGAYMLLFPRRRVTVILFRFLTQVPAYVAIGMWFVFQLISGLGALGDRSQLGGVAYAAHVGGFVSGLVLVKPFMIGRPPKQWNRLPSGRVRW